MAYSIALSATLSKVSTPTFSFPITQTLSAHGYYEGIVTLEATSTYTIPANTEFLAIASSVAVTVTIGGQAFTVTDLFVANGAFAAGGTITVPGAVDAELNIFLAVSQALT